ncbi:MAG: RNA polymerase sigma factor [Acutalibacter sp.]|jgi:RNA polymerase sigma factor (sigma-70 family)
MEDIKIVELYWSRDPQAIAQSQEKYGPYCFSVAHGILESLEDSEECVNDTWVAAWNRMPPHRPDFLRMFLAKITRRLAFNRYKAVFAQKRGGGQVPLVLDELEECVAGTEDVEAAFDAQELGQCVRHFVNGLPPREGDVFVRRYFFADPIREIAKTYGLTENHVSVILSRVRKKLREYLEKEGFLNER